MAPPTRLRSGPHLDDLLQKNLELEHLVADLRHQLTQSSARWVDERRTLSAGCDVLMASFTKFRARLDIQPSDCADSEGEVEHSLDVGRQSEEAGEADNKILETKGDEGSSVTEGLRERCRTLAADLQAREEELEESWRKCETAEEELQRIQRLLDAQSEQLRAALASSKADASSKTPPGRAVDNASTPASPPKSQAGPENTLDKLELTNQEINRLKRLLQEWKRYGSEWKRDGQAARVRASELQRRENELSAQVKAAEESKAHQDAEIQRLTQELANQTSEAERQCSACQESVKRVHDLEVTVAHLRATLSPQQLAAFDAGQSQVEQNQAAPGLASIQAAVPQPDTITSKRGDLILLKIPYRGLISKPSTENNGSPQAKPQDATPLSRPAPATQPIRASPVPQRPPRHSINPAEFEVCTHTCNKSLCRNDSRSFLWPRKQHSLPRHVLSTKKHQLCSLGCPAHRLLKMPLADARREPRKVKCRPPTEAELALATDEASKAPPSQPENEKETGVGGVGSESESPLSDLEEVREPEGGSAHEEETQVRGEEEQSSRIGTLSTILGKRLRPRTTDEAKRASKLRPRISIAGKP